MSNATLRPSRGSWGPFGTAPGSKIGKIRRAIDWMPHKSNYFGFKESQTSGGDTPRLPSRLPDQSSDSGFLTTQRATPYNAPTVTAYTKTPGQFDTWYKRYRQAMVEEPIAKMTDPDEPGSWFRRITQEEKDLLDETKSVTGKGADDLIGLGSDGGILEGGRGYLPTEVGTPTNLSDQLAVAQAAYDREIAAVGDLATEYKEDLGDIERDYLMQRRAMSTQRQGAAAGQAEVEQARQASIAQSGFEYSGPAAAKAGLTAGQSGDTMEGLQEAALKQRREYEDIKGQKEQDITDLEDRKTIAEETLQTKKGTIADSLYKLYDTGESAIAASLGEMKGIMSAHKGLHGVGSQAKGWYDQRKTEGIKAFRDIPGPYFAEGDTNIPEYGMGLSRFTEAENLLNRLQQARRIKTEKQV